MLYNHLSVMVPNRGCNKNCEYCYQRMKPNNYQDEELFQRNLPKMENFARTNGITSISLTGSGEPLLYPQMIIQLCDTFSNFPLELQTNAIKLDSLTAKLLFEHGLDTISVKIDHMKSVKNFYNVFQYIHHELGMTIRLNINLINEMYRFGLDDYIDLCRENFAQQLTFHCIGVPLSAGDTDLGIMTRNWIVTHVDDMEMEEFIKNVSIQLISAGEPVRAIPYDTELYMYKGISVTILDFHENYIDDENECNSFVYHEDGHLSTSWQSSAYGRLF